MVGQTVSHYRIQQRRGGDMHVVSRARDLIRVSFEEWKHEQEMDTSQIS
jgi:hypothetical protein